MWVEGEIMITTAITTITAISAITTPTITATDGAGLTAREKAAGREGAAFSQKAPSPLRGLPTL